MEPNQKSTNISITHVSPFNSPSSGEDLKVPLYLLPFRDRGHYVKFTFKLLMFHWRNCEHGIQEGYGHKSAINRQSQDQGFGMTVVMKGWFPFCPFFFFFGGKTDTRIEMSIYGCVGKEETRKRADSINRSRGFIRLRMRKDQDVWRWPALGSSFEPWGQKVICERGAWGQKKKMKCNFKDKVRGGQIYPDRLETPHHECLTFQVRAAELCHC